MIQFRARGLYLPTMRDSWVTTCWRDSIEEAQFDVKAFCGDRYRDIRIITRDR
jgi:hypothetical protein